MNEEGFLNGTARVRGGVELCHLPNHFPSECGATVVLVPLGSSDIALLWEQMETSICLLCSLCKNYCLLARLRGSLTRAVCNSGSE